MPISPTSILPMLSMSSKSVKSTNPQRFSHRAVELPVAKPARAFIPDPGRSLRSRSFASSLDNASVIAALSRRSGSAVDSAPTFSPWFHRLAGIKSFKPPSPSSVVARRWHKGSPSPRRVKNEVSAASSARLLLLRFAFLVFWRKHCIYSRRTWHVGICVHVRKDVSIWQEGGSLGIFIRFSSVSERANKL